MQLAKVSAALARLDEVRLPFISIPPIPRPAASPRAMPCWRYQHRRAGALIGSPGRASSTDIRQKLPKGFRRRNFFSSTVPRRRRSSQGPEDLYLVAFDFSWRSRMTYEESVRYLLSLGRSLPRRSSDVAKFDLANITTLCERLGQPQRAFQSCTSRHERKRLNRRDA